VRATRGLEAEIQRRFSLAVGTGFAGTIAATRAPLFLRDASRDPLPKSQFIRERGLHALYGVPLIDEDDVIGVVHMGSTIAYEFQEEDLILFRGLASRIASHIARRRTLDQHRERELLREQFVGILAHDLRSPLSAIRGSAQLLLRKQGLEESDRAALSGILRAAQRMGRLISDVLDFTRARLGSGLPVSLAFVDLAGLARTSCEEARSANAGRNVDLTTEITSPVWCDADRIAQLLSNLVSNALRHGAQDAPVSVSITETPDDASIAVHNEGPVVPSELAPHLFQPFRKGREGKTEGLGLGLFIAKSIAVAHGGSIEFQSTQKQGTTFLVRLPKRRA
jgi:signal transduction histidine kinase